MNFIGLDIGGTKITGIVFDGKKTLKILTIPTPKSLPSFTATLKKLVETLSAGLKVDGVGIGMAGVVDREKLTVVHSPNLKFIENFKFKELLPAFKKIRLDNDANCFSRAESVLGQGKGLKAFVGLTLGTGIGGGLVDRGEIYYGAHGSAGEAGHMMLDPGHTFEYYFQKARAASNYKQIAKIIGLLLANIYNFLDTECVILGGSVAVKSGDKFIEAATLHSQKYLLNRQIQPKILISKLENAGAIGAALLLK